MPRAAFALLFALPALAACATRQTPEATVVVEAPPEPPTWIKSATAADQAALAALRGRFAAARAAVPRRLAARLRAESALADPYRALPMPQLPPGPYHCRLVRFGGRARFATFKPDFCNVDAGEANAAFTKQTGANLPEGWIYPDSETRQVFLGTLRREGEAGGRRYGDDPARDIAGVIERVSPFRWRLILTRAGDGATLDLYELVPVTPLVPGAPAAVPDAEG